MLVVHGRTVRPLDEAGVRDVELWDARQVSGPLLLMLGFASLGLLAVLGPRREVGIFPPAA